MPTVLVNDNIFHIADGTIIFDGLEKQNLTIPNGCLAGVCGVCIVEIKSGAKNLSAPGAVELDTLSQLADGDKILRLACRAKVLGDITVSY